MFVLYVLRKNELIFVSSENSQVMKLKKIVIIVLSMYFM
jgi:hypothetical protein